jgi:hypothetical protein
MEVMALDVPIRAVGATEAVKDLDTVAKAGQRTAALYSAAWTKTSTDVLGMQKRIGDAEARRTAASAAASARAAERARALQVRREQQTIASEANLANHFRQMREREIQAAERAAYAMQAAMDRQNKTVALTAAGYQKWGNAAIRGAGALALLADAAADTDRDFQTFLRTGSSIAFMFGPTGAVVGSVGIAASVIVSLFGKAREEMKKTEDAFRQSLDRVRDNFDASGAWDIVQQTGIAKEGARESQSNIEARLRAAEVRARRDRSPAAQGAVNRLLGELEAAKALTAQAERRYADALRVFDNAERISSEIEANRRRIAEGPTGPASARGPSSIPLRGIGAPGLALGVPRLEKLAMQFATPDTGAKMAQPAIAALAAFEGLVGAQVDRVSASIGDGLQRGFEMAFSGEGIEGLFKGFGGTVMSALGSMFVELGKHLIFFGSIMTTLKEKLTNFFTSGPAALVAGAALIALGSAMTAGAGKIMSGGSASRGGGAPSAGSTGQGLVDTTSRYRYNPMTGDMSKLGMPAPVHITIIGKDDIRAQNDLTEMVRRAQRRGV